MKVPHAVCVVTEEREWTYSEVDAESNWIAQGLITKFQIKPQHRVASLLAPGIDAYLAMLAILKCGATYVPLDPLFPQERIEMICQDADAQVILRELEISNLRRGLLGNSARPLLDVGSDDLAYIIYTSGTTGRPKGVGISHGNICNFLEAISSIYQVKSSDRVYQGMTPSFDFSLEEVWPTWIAGAVLIPFPSSGGRLVGDDLLQFLRRQRVSVLHCVPTLLATLHGELPELHTLNVGGEACPQDLVKHWSRPGRRMLNTYGPTETTITASWTELTPDRPVTIGKALPTYDILLLADDLTLVPDGQPGEICIGGPGVANGYLNRPDLTAEKFIHIEERRYYRTGDSGRLLENGEIEFLGRIDTQVKIRGYRIELGEIESLISEKPFIEQVLVNPFVRQDGITILIAYLVVHASEPLSHGWQQSLREELRSKLPAYMVPQHFEILSKMPTQVSGKADRKNLPHPTTLGMGDREEGHAERVAGELECLLEVAWCNTFQLANIAATTHFFFDLGGDSLSVAILVSELRKDPRFVSMSMADIYQNPTIRSLAEHIEAKGWSATAPLPREIHQASTWKVAVAGLVQFTAVYTLLIFFSESLVDAIGVDQLGNWALVAATYIGMTVLVWLLMPVAIKWIVIGRFKPGRYPLWGSYFLRWWIVRTALRFVPWSCLAGTPIIRIYLMALGAKIGADCYIGSKNLILPDLVTVGPGAHIGYNVDILAHEIRDGWLYLSPVEIGSGAYIGTNSLVFLGSRVGERALVGELSLVPRDGAVPPGEYWQGSPAAPAEMPEALLQMMERPAGSPVPLSLGWVCAYLAGSVSLYLIMFVSQVPCIALLEEPVRNHQWWHALAWLIPGGAANVIFTCGLLALAKRLILPNICEGIHPINSSLAWRKWYCDKLMETSLDVVYSLYATIYTKYWLRLLGVQAGRGSEISTVSYFDPNLLTLGKNSFIADMATVGAAIFHNGWFSVKKTVVGSRSFVGNCAHLSQGCDMGNQSLLGVLSYRSGSAINAEASWLGSPALLLHRREILNIYDESVTFTPPLGMVILRYTIEFFRIVIPQCVISLAFVITLQMQQALSVGHSVWVTMVLSPACFFIVGGAATLFTIAMKWILVRRYQPRMAPLWSPFVWTSEMATGLYENISLPLLLSWFGGSPIYNFFMRLYGTHIGRRVFCDTNCLTEFDMVEIGDDAAIAENVSLQSHLFEDRIMKLSHIRIAKSATVGHRSVVLYNTEVGQLAVLSPLSLVMKGEVLPAGTLWQGIPVQLRADSVSALDQASLPRLSRLPCGLPSACISNTKPELEPLEMANLAVEKNSHAAAPW